MYISRPLTRVILAIVLLAVVGVAAWRIGATGSGDSADTEVRVALRPLADGRTEVAVQQRHAGRNQVGWGERLTPDARFLPPDAEPGRWLVSSPVSLAVDAAQSQPFGSEPLKPEPLKIAFLQTVGGTDHERRNSFKLAIQHINAAGGVLGQPVVGVIADINFDTDFAVAVARRLVLEEDVHAFVGPNTSSASLALIEAVIEPFGIPTISPSATAPALSSAPDRDFFFRAVPSDSVQGPVLAQLARERGHDNVGVVFRDDAWGRGLAETFRSAWTGAISAAALESNPDSCADELRHAAANDAGVLIVLVFGPEAVLCVEQALELELFDRFILGDGAQSLSLSARFDADILARMIGVASTSGPASASSRFWESEYAAVWGAAPSSSLAYIRAVYDAAIALALASQTAASTDGSAIRDALRSVADGEGPAFSADQLPEAINAIANAEAFDYLGVESSLVWDANGDITRFQIGIWQFTADGQIEIVRTIPYDLGD